MIGFLEAIWGTDRPGLYGELRFIRDGKVLQSFYPLNYQNLIDADQEIQKLNGQGWDAYYGVLPRIRRSGTADDVYQGTTILWVDIDSKQFGDDGTQAAKEAALAALRKPSLDANIIVDSGGGYHAYWLLDREMSLEWGSQVMKGLARDVGGDHVADPPRVLRIPGSFNWKRGAPRPARLLAFDLRFKYRPSDLSDYLDFEVRLAPPIEGAFRFERRDLPEWLVDLIEDGAPKGQRSEAAFKACLWLIRFGRSDAEIEAIFAGTPAGIGAKYHERGPQWLERTIRAAEKRA